MDYSNNSLDPEVLEFYCPNRSKNVRCHTHHHAHQHQGPRGHPQQSGPSHAPHSAYKSGYGPTAAHHTVSATAIADASKPFCASGPQTVSGPEHFHHHAQRYRSSVSPVQTISSACSSSASTLTSSSGICRTGPGSGAGGSSHSGQKSVTSLRAIDLLKLLREKIALLPGGRSRQGGPILCFPSNSRADEILFDDLCMLVLYLTFLPEERVKKLGFTVIVDMRNGTTWHSVKPILKVVEQCIGTNVAMAYIIKPDRLFEKHKANMAIGKFSYEIQLVSLETLFREVDPSQLTAELEGSLPYHHEEWIQIRCRLEEFFVSAHDMSDKFGQLFCFLERRSELCTVVEAKRALEEHRSIRLKIVQAPVSALEAEADRLITWLRYGMAAANSSSSVSSASGSSGIPSLPTGTGTASSGTGSGGGASFLATSWVSMNPDFQQMVPLVRQTVAKLYEYRAHLQQKWETGRSRLEQIYQLRIFDEDAERMANWLGQQRHLFLTEYLDIGQNASHAADLLAEHRQFVSSCTIAFEQVARLNGVAGILADVGHFASQQILKKAGQLEHEWKSFAAALEDRSRVLCLSASFHSRAQSFLANCQHRESAMRQVTGSTVNELNQALLTLQNYWQETQSSHEEVCADGRALTDHLSAPVPTGSHTSLTAAVDYSQGRKHCTDLVHEIWAWYKRLERVYTERKTRLTSRLSLLMFKEDVGQVLAWLSEHGEPFLHRQTAVGKSIQRAEQLYNTHMQFEQVAAKTLTNAEKLISVADELAAQADDPEEILQKASELQRRISAFTRAVESRRETVDLGCGFYSHTIEVLAWLHGVRKSHNPSEHLPATIEGMEDELTNFRRERTMIEEGADRVASEGEALTVRLKDSEEVAHIRSVLAQVANGRTTVSALLTERQVRLDLCLQLRLFEADVHSALDCLRHGVPHLVITGRGTSDTSSLGNSSTGTSTNLLLPPSSSTTPTGLQPSSATGSVTNASSTLTITTPPWLADPRQAPDLTALEEISNACLAVLPTAEEVLNKGGELARAFDSVGVNFPAGGPGSSDSGVGDSVETAVERVHRLINELAEAVTAVDELNERISGELDWRRLQLQSRQVLHWIEQCEDILRETAVIPATLAEATALQAEHEKFQPVLTDAHPQAVQCAARASYLLQQATQASTPTSSSGTPEHPHLKDYQSVAEAVANRWQSLVYAAADRHKLLLAATNWYKTSDQVTSVLWSLEKEYHREEDWCQSEKATLGGDTAAYLNQLSVKHAEQKEAFLKACMLARRTSDGFSRYLHRQPASTTGRAEVEERMRTAMSVLMAKEQAVLEAWAVRRRRLDDCIYFINIKRLVEELLTRVHNQSQHFSSPSKGPVTLTASSQLTSSLIQEVNRACESLESMIAASMPLSPGHTIQLKALLSRLQATLPNATPSPSELAPIKPPQFTGSTTVTSSSNEATRLSSDLSKPGVTNVTSRLEIPAPRGKQLPHPETDTDRTSVSSTSSSGAGSTSTCASDVFLVSPSAGGPAATAGPTPEQRRMIRRRENLLRELIQTERTYVQALEQCLETYRKGLMTRQRHWNRSYLPLGLVGKTDVVFGNMQDIFEFHKQTFEPELGKYTESGDFLPEDVGHCFVVHSDRLAELYVAYCVNNTESTRLMIDHGHTYFQALQGLTDDLQISTLGDVILQDQFTVWEPKQLIKKSRERRVFLFDNCLILAKEAPSQAGEHKAKYVHLPSLFVSFLACLASGFIEFRRFRFPDKDS
ncbi:Kalirin [Fasciola gigantica]|uniref:Kalirin n=1 Tax=Fasciola gigantica TaxID=46835 RepID=A0A504YT03_FASGI|nr:Kalirin [Fasciola gigantica]